MKTIGELNLGFSDAENYKLRENKALFNKFFLKDENLDSLLKSSTSFLIGEKGTGKTAYAVYLSNGSHPGVTADIKSIRESEYTRFFNLINQKKIEISSYPDVWRVILMLLIIKNIKDGAIEQTLFSGLKNFNAINDAIDHFYNHAFSPEIQNAITFIEESKDAASLTAKFLKAEGFERKETTFSESRMQINLMYIEHKFKDCIRSLKLKSSHILFIDGIDVRPGNIPYDGYLECIKGLAAAAWSLNNDFFSGIKDSKGRIRVVLLLRPDIFHSLGMHNSTNKISDNSVFLDWRTTYPEYRGSRIFAVTDRILSTQQELNYPKGACWDYYFPFKLPTTSISRGSDNSFISLLRYSFSRPRDVIRIMEIMKSKVSNAQATAFTEKDFSKNEVLNGISEYLMGSIKDQLAFYYTEKEYQLFLIFFTYLDGYFEFDYTCYLNAFKRFKLDPRISGSFSEFIKNENDFLQFLYELNIICTIDFKEDGTPMHSWCYRERDLSNFHPKVKLNATYRVHFGLRKALNLFKTR